jgi:hypothetical protein
MPVNFGKRLCSVLLVCKSPQATNPLPEAGITESNVQPIEQGGFYARKEDARAG